MTLLAIIFALGTEYFLGVAEGYRSLAWFGRWTEWVRRRLGGEGRRESWWRLLLAVGVPVFAAALAWLALAAVSGLAAYAAGIFVLIYCLGPRDLHAQLQSYLRARDEGDEQGMRQLAAEITGSPAGGMEEFEWAVVEAVVVEPNHRVFAVLFWYALLGPVAALAYRLSDRYRLAAGDTDAVARDWHALLAWAPSRMAALGYALAGSMVNALGAWRSVEEKPLHANDTILRETGIAAMQLSDAELGPVALDAVDQRYRIQAAQGLVLRCLLMWLTVIALLTLGGLAS